MSGRLVAASTTTFLIFEPVELGQDSETTDSVTWLEPVVRAADRHQRIHLVKEDDRPVRPGARA